MSQSDYAPFQGAAELTIGEGDERLLWRDFVRLLVVLDLDVFAGHIAAGWLSGADPEFAECVSAHTHSRCFLCDCIADMTDVQNFHAPIGSPAAYAIYACGKKYEQINKNPMIRRPG